MRLEIGGYELSAFNGVVIELDRWNSPYKTRQIVRLRYHNNGREVEYSYKELAITGAMITSIVESTDKKIHFAQRWKKNGNWDWVLVVENSKYRVVYECYNPLTLDRDALRVNKWYKALKPFLGEFATIGLIAWEWDGLIGIQDLRKQEDKAEEEGEESHEQEENSEEETTTLEAKE
jgi:hypothetical protein